MKQLESGDAPLALVVGLSVHGLAIVRALSRAGIEVHGLEQNANAPTVHTRYGKVHIADGVNSDRVVRLLLDLRPMLKTEGRVVLFPTSDTIVRAIANGWPLLEPHYTVSWHACRSLVLTLQRKDSLAELAEQRQVSYPRSCIVAQRADISQARKTGEYPLIVKPVRPLSSFKAIKVSSQDDLTHVFDSYSNDLPFLVQQWVEGDETQLHFCTMYLHHGQILASFTGRKLLALPRDTGMGTVVESTENLEVADISRRFIEGLDLSGPIAIEYKRDSRGIYWLIEPNVGRTEYSVDLLIEHGVNLPLIEYWATQGTLIAPTEVRLKPTIWFDTERDVMSYLKFCVRTKSFRPFGKQPVFPYFGHDDPSPLVRAICARVSNLVRGLLRRLVRRGGDPHPAPRKV